MTVKTLLPVVHFLLDGVACAASLSIHSKRLCCSFWKWEMYQMQEDVSFITRRAEARQTHVDAKHLKRLTLLSQMVDVSVTGND